MPAARTKASPRRIPSMDRILRDPGVREALEEAGPEYGREILRRAVADLRRSALEGSLQEADLRLQLEALPGEIRARVLAEARGGLVPLINATGVIVHTNLGRALLGEEASRRVASVCGEFVNLEFEIESGRRGRRTSGVGRILAGVFPRHAAHVVNNNAAALLIALNTLAEGREVVVSRGELVEIGGSFRLPEILAKSGARLREVGTTNRTRASDYARALGRETGAVLRVHPSNYRIVGFTEAPALADLAWLARRRRVPLLVDEGAGNLHDLEEVGIAGEPTVQRLLEEGADLVTFSGDKLLGGPQAGILVGRQDLVERIRSNPLARALRVDKMTLAALEATLLAHRRGTHLRDVPVQRMIALTPEDLRPRVERLAAAIRAGCDRDLDVSVREGESRIGGGAAPVSGLPTLLVALRPRRQSAAGLARRMRSADPPVITRTGRDAVLIDLRAVPAERDEAILRAVRAAAGREETGPVRRGTGT